MRYQLLALQYLLHSFPKVRSCRMTFSCARLDEELSSLVDVGVSTLLVRSCTLFAVLDSDRWIEENCSVVHFHLE